MANFKITATTTVAELKEQFHNEFGGILRVYQGRSEAPEEATLVSLGGKVGELECRASRTVGKFIEAFQSELGLKVKVYTKDNWVSVLDGITLATVREIPKNARKAQMEQYLAYQRDEKEEVTEEAKADEVEISEEFKGIPLIDMPFKKIEGELNGAKLEEISEEDWYGDFGAVMVFDADGEYNFVQLGDLDYDIFEAAQSFIANKKLADYSVYVCDTTFIYGLDKDAYEFGEEIGHALNEFTGASEYYFSWDFNKKVLFRVKLGEKIDIFTISKDGYFDSTWDMNKEFDKLIELTEAGLNNPAPEKFNPENYTFSEGLAPVKSEETYKWGYINEKGEVVIPLIYEIADDFKEGIARVKSQDELWGCINVKGETVVPINLEMLWPFENGFAIGRKEVEEDDDFEYKWGVINLNGEIAIPFEYDWIGSNSEELFGFDKDGKRGYLTANGKIAIEPIYDEVREFCDGYAVVKKGDKYGMIDKTGQEILPCIYDYISGDGFDHLGEVKVEMNDEYFYVNKKGERVEE